MTRPQVYGLLLFLMTVLVTVTADEEGNLIRMPQHQAQPTTLDDSQIFAFDGGPASLLTYQ